MDGRIVKGLPRRARAASGPSRFRGVSQPTTLLETVGDVEMNELLQPGTPHRFWTLMCLT